MLPLFLALQATMPAEIVVTGRGLADAPGDRAYDVVTIDRDRLTGTASGRLEDVLRDVAGFQQFRRSDSRSAQPTSQGATLRGLGGNASSRALVLLDGVPQIDPFGGWVSFPAFDPIRLGRVRVTRGGGSGVNGPGALAGTIELASAGRGDGDGLSAGLAYGSRDAVDADAMLSAPLGAGYGFVAGGYARGDGFVPVVAEARGPADRPSPYEQASLALRGVVPLGADSELQASGLGFYDRRERGLAFTGNRNVGADASLRLIGRGAWGYEVLGYVQLRDFASSFASVDAARTAATRTLDQYRVPATGTGGRLEIRPPLGGDLLLRIGGDWRATDGETKELYTYTAGVPGRIRAAGGRTATLGGFAEGSWEPGGGWTLTAGGRIDRWWIADGFLREAVLATGVRVTDQRFADRSGWRPTARGGVAYAMDDALTLRGAAYLGWRLPTLNELYRPFRAGTDATAANAALSPETSRGADAGIEWRPFPGMRLGTTLFWNRLDDAIANVSLGTGPGTFPGVGFVGAGGAYRRRDNLDHLRARGVEVDADLAINLFRLRLSYARTEARMSADGAATALDGRRPAQTPRDQASATLGWADGGYSLSGTARYTSSQYEDDLNARALRDALTFDAVLAVPVARRVALELRGENLANRRVEAGVTGANVIERAAPRTLWLGLRLGV
jgi:outer membrane receptor protein involved in Fe transport